MKNFRNNHKEICMWVCDCRFNEGSNVNKSNVNGEKS